MEFFTGLFTSIALISDHAPAVQLVFKIVLQRGEYRRHHPVDQRGCQIHGEDLQRTRGDKLRLTEQLRHWIVAASEVSFTVLIKLLESGGKATRAAG